MDTNLIANRELDVFNEMRYDQPLNDDLTFTSREVVVADHIKGNTEKGNCTQKLTDEGIEIIEKAKMLNPHGTYLLSQMTK